MQANFSDHVEKIVWFGGKVVAVLQGLAAADPAKGGLRRMRPHDFCGLPMSSFNVSGPFGSLEIPKNQVGLPRDPKDSYVDLKMLQ